MTLSINIKLQKYSSNSVLENIEVNFETGNIYGIIGKNGQGKTTLFKCVLGLINYTGNINFKNVPLKINDVAWCPTEPLIYDDLTAEEFKNFYKELLNIKKNENNDLFEIPNNKRVKEFSTGMKKKAYLNAIFQKDYPIYILDEPFNGLDIESNHKLMEYLKKKSKNSIVLISTHILESLYNDCYSINLIQDKKMREFKKENFSDIKEILFEN